MQYYCRQKRGECGTPWLFKLSWQLNKILATKIVVKVSTVWWLVCLWFTSFTLAVWLLRLEILHGPQSPVAIVGQAFWLFRFNSSCNIAECLFSFLATNISRLAIILLLKVAKSLLWNKLNLELSVLENLLFKPALKLNPYQWILHTPTHQTQKQIPNKMPVIPMWDSRLKVIIKHIVNGINLIQLMKYFIVVHQCQDRSRRLDR